MLLSVALDRYTLVIYNLIEYLYIKYIPYSEDMIMRMQQLEQVLAIAEEGSINKAAQKLYLSQPNL